MKALGFGLGGLLLGGILAACGSEPRRTEEPAPPVPAADDSIPASPQRPGDAKRGWEALVSEPYVGCGVPRTLWTRFGFTAPEAWRVPRTRGAELPYFMNAAKLASGVEVVTANCLGCHAGFLRGELVVGLGEQTMDFTMGASTELAVAGLMLPEAERGEHAKLVSRMRALEPHIQTRTIGANPADHIAAVLFAHRDPETLAWSDEPLIPLADEPPIPVDVPAWWLLKRKTAMFHTGAGRGDQARIMMTASVLCVDDVATARAIDAYFPDVRAFILSLEPPKFPGPIDATLAARGRAVYDDACAKCHGVGASYRSRVIPLADIGTDPRLARHGQFATPFVRWFNRSFYGEVARLEPGDGYVPPPLDGVWATAPYLHNGSVPTLRDLLLPPDQRPRTFYRGNDLYDPAAVGFVSDVAAEGTQRYTRIDTTLEGNGNGGHVYGTDLSEAERSALLEYLKTL